MIIRLCFDGGEYLRDWPVNWVGFAILPGWKVYDLILLFTVIQSIRTFKLRCCFCFVTVECRLAKTWSGKLTRVDLPHDRRFVGLTLSDINPIDIKCLFTLETTIPIIVNSEFCAVVFVRMALNLQQESNRYTRITWLSVTYIKTYIRTQSTYNICHKHLISMMKEWPRNPIL